MEPATRTITNVKQAAPFLRVNNIEESVRYYVEGLGFEMTKKWIHESELRIQASRPFVGNGMWVTSISDPDGYRIDFESYTDAPEDSE